MAIRSDRRRTSRRQTTESDYRPAPRAACGAPHGLRSRCPSCLHRQRRRVDKLVDRGIVRLAARDRYYLDEDALQEWHSRQWAVAFSFLVIAAGVATAWALIAWLAHVPRPRLGMTIQFTIYNFKLFNL